MNADKIKPAFGRLRLGKISVVGRVNLPHPEKIEKLTENADVFIKTCEKEFPYKNNPATKMSSEALKIIARPLNLGFWDKLLNKKTITEYFPIGNIKDMIVFDKNKKVADVVKEVVAKVNKL